MDIKVFVVSLTKQDYGSNYFELLNQLSTIDRSSISKSDFDYFVDNLNDNHIIKLIKTIKDKKIIGTITVIKEQKLIHNNGKVAHIEDVVVDNDFRGHGIGRMLVEIAKMESTDCYKIILNCDHKVSKFYTNCGFKHNGNHMALYKDSISNSRL